MPEAKPVIARAINASGDIVGDYGQGFQATQVFIYSKGSMKRMPSTSDSGQNRAISVTDSGRVLINSANVSIGPRSWHVSTYGSDGKLVTVSELEGRSAVATGMNSSEAICGFFYTLDRGEHAFIFERGVVRDIGSLGGGTASANAINVDGAVVGRSRTRGGSDAGHAFLFHDNRMIDLGTLGGLSSIVMSINATGIIVGRTQTKGGSEVAFIFENGRMFDLNSLLEHQLPDSIRLRQATAINDSSQILAEGIERVGGRIKTHGYLLTLR